MNKIQKCVLLILGVCIGGLLSFRFFGDDSGKGDAADSAAQVAEESEQGGVPSFSQPLHFADLLAETRASSGNEIRITAGPVNGADLERLSPDMDWLKTLVIDEGIVTDVSMGTISQLPNLRHLRLRHSPISDAGLRTLSSCPKLAVLNLPHAACSAEGLKHLTALSGLVNLRLGSPNLDAKAAEVIAELKTLRSLHLIGVPIDDEGLEKIAGLPELESLYLDDSMVTDAGWQWLFDNHSDLHIHVNQGHHDRDPNESKDHHP